MGIFIDFTLQGESEERRSAFHHGSREARLLGDDHFVEQSLAEVQGKIQVSNYLEQIIEAVCTVYKMTPSIPSPFFYPVSVRPPDDCENG